MAVVYKAYDSVLQRTVALKVLLPQLAANEEFTRRFRREAITAANLRHPNIVVIYDVGSHENFQYIVMEYLEGATLQQEIQQQGALPTSRVIFILRQLAAALDYAHCQRLVHRDVKPANVIIDAQDRATLTDFGLVKAATSRRITGEGAAVGTLKYMSPEQAAGKELDGRSDTYSLAVVVYEMLVGDTPFTGTTPYQTLHNLMYKAPPPLSQRNPQISLAAERIVLRALSKDPGNRFGSAGEFARALAAATGIAAGEDVWHDTDPMKGRGALADDLCLILTNPDGRQFPVHRGTATIGRDTGNDVVLPVRQVSRQHAQIQCGPTGCTIVDLGSTNGTFINGAPVQPKKPQPLRPGDVLGVGPVVLTVTLPDRPGDSGCPPADSLEARTTDMELKRS